MTIVVPFDGGPLSTAALDRGGELGRALDQSVVSVTVLPNSNLRYARERGWIGENEPFDPDKILSELSEQVYTLVPRAEFEYEAVGRYAQPGEIASRIRRMAHAEDADLVILGSDNAGRIVNSVTSVASPVAADDSYDVMIVRHADKQYDMQHG